MPLHTFNRALAVAFGAALLITGTLGALVAAGGVGPASIAPAGWFREPLLELSRREGASEIAALATVSVVAMAGLALMIVELLPQIRHRYMTAGNGTRREFAVREEAVERMVRYAGTEVEGVRRIEYAHVRRSNRGLEIKCSAVLEPEALAGPLGPLLEARLCNAVYAMTGLPVGEVRLRMMHARPAREYI